MQLVSDAGDCALGPHFRIAAADGISVVILPYGAIVQSITVPDGEGGTRQVLANYATLKAYKEDRAYVGCLVGRTANRIRDARLERDGRIYGLSANEGRNHLHGGVDGFNRRDWTVTFRTDTYVALLLQSPAGDQGYPGRLVVNAAFEIVDSNTLKIEYEAQTDSETPVDLTHHLYFNLGGEFDRTIGGHGLQVEAQSVLELDAGYVPTGGVIPIAGTPFDLSRPEKLATVLAGAHPQLTDIGLNQAWVVVGQPALSLISPDGALRLDVKTDQPCVQLYSGLDPSLCAGGALAIEPQGYLDAATVQTFPSPWLAPGQIYRRTTLYRFVTQKASE